MNKQQTAGFYARDLRWGIKEGGRQFTAECIAGGNAENTFSEFCIIIRYYRSTADIITTDFPSGTSRTQNSVN